MRLSHRRVLTAILYVAEHGCKWRGLPAQFGKWHTVYTRMNRWAKRGVLERVFAALQRGPLVRITLQAVSVDRTSVQVHPDGTGALKKTEAIGKSWGGWTTTLHLVAADARTALTLALSPGQAHDAPEGRRLLRRLKPEPAGLAVLMDRAYEGDETRHLALELGFTPVVPPKRHRVAPWPYDRQLYRKRNAVARLFRRLKAFRRIFPRFDKLDALFLGFIHFALIVDALR